MTEGTKGGMGKNSESKGNTKSALLREWQDRLAESDRAYLSTTKAMDAREKLYGGDSAIRPLVTGDAEKSGAQKTASHVRNIVFENIESQVNSAIPQPKVTPRRKEDEPLAEVIENFLRNELDRLPFERLNDMAERTVPIQGGVAFLVEWDNSRRTNNTIGEVVVSLLHPKQLAPQPGVYTSIEDMDWIILKIPTTKETVRRKYGVDVRDEGESEPDVRGGDNAPTDYAITQYMGYAKNDEGGIDRYSWVNDTELEDLRDYQARRAGGEVLRAEPIGLPYGMAMPPGIAGMQVQGLLGGLMPEIPYYEPGAYPVVLQRSVSVYGQLLGNSDVDVMRDQQNTTNRIEQKIIDRIIKAGSRITLPAEADIRIDPEDAEKLYIKNPSDKALIDVYDFKGDISPEMAYLAGIYEEARQVIGITDSFQGRKDSTATSGKAKEFAAAQSAGRLESKRVMKDAAYADLFELIFKFALAYADEPRPVVYKNSKGENEYREFDRRMFLQQGENGEYYWNDQFLFSTDTSAPLASNREAMWQETRMNLQTGAFGDPTQTETLILFWSKMEELHYPGAASTKKFLEEKIEREQSQMAQQAAIAQQPGAGAPQGLPGIGGGMQGPPAPQGPPMGAGPQQGGMPPELQETGYADAGAGIPPQVRMAIERQAQEAAMRDAGMR